MFNKVSKSYTSQTAAEGNGGTKLRKKEPKWGNKKTKGVGGSSQFP
jgi:hypothetical protein